MANEATDELKLIDETVMYVGLLGKTILPAPGFSKEIFRAGQPLGSVRASGDETGLSAECPPGITQLKARNKDAVLTVNLGPCALKLEGSFYTSDSYTATYNVRVELRVNNPALFARRYIQKSDPIGLLRSAIVQEFNEYASRTPHDQLSKVKLRHDVRYNVQNAKTGLLITEVYAEIYADPRRARMRKIEQEAEVTKTEIQTNAELDVLRHTHGSNLANLRQDSKLEGQAKENNFARRESKKDLETELQKQVIAETTKKVLDLWNAQLDNDMDSNIPITEIAENNPIIQNILSLLYQPPELLSASENERNKQLKGPAQVKQELNGLPPVTPRIDKNAPKMPIPESDTGQFREVDNTLDEE